MWRQLSTSTPGTDTKLPIFSCSWLTMCPSTHFTAIFNCQHSLSTALDYYKVFQALWHTFQPLFTQPGIFHHSHNISLVFNTCSFSNRFPRFFASFHVSLTPHMHIQWTTPTPAQIRPFLASINCFWHNTCLKTSSSCFTAILNCKRLLSTALSYYEVFRALRHTFRPLFTHFPLFSISHLFFTPSAHFPPIFYAFSRVFMCL